MTMLNRYRLLHTGACLVLTCTVPPIYCIAAPEMTLEDIFHVTKQEAQKQFGDKTYKRIIEAIDDFDAVLRRKLPKHARRDDRHPLPADGGTSFYSGKGIFLQARYASNKEEQK